MLAWLVTLTVNNIIITYVNCIHYTVPASQSEVTVMQSDDNQSRQDDESSQVKHTNGL